LVFCPNRRVDSILTTKTGGNPTQARFTLARRAAVFLGLAFAFGAFLVDAVRAGFFFSVESRSPNRSRRPAGMPIRITTIAPV
jgi:hypothetical protein